MNACPLRAEFDELGTSARAAGMGDCDVAIADDAFGVFYNPAGLGMMHHVEFATTSSKLLTGLSDMNTIEENIIGAVYGTRLNGGFGVGLHTFNVPGLYEESTSMLSYGRHAWKDLYLGASMKYMSKSYVSNAYTENAIDFSGDTYGRDPVFANGYGKAFMSYDIGSYYQLNKRMSLAFVAKDITSPDTGLASESQLPMTATLGMCYKEEDILIPFEVQSKGGDVTYSAGFERWMFSEALALRAGLQEGSGSLSEVSCGMSYSYNSIIRFDYGFSMPLDGISGTNGSHRLSLVVSIGKPRGDVFELTKQPKDYQDAVMAFEHGQYLTAYDLFETIIKSLESSRQLKEHSEVYIKEIISRMQAKVKENLAASQVAYAKGLLAYSQPDYEGALTQLEAFAGIIADNTEVNYYIELLKKMLGKQNKPVEEKKAQGEQQGQGPQRPDEYPGLEGQGSDPMMANMGREDYISFKLRASLMDFKQGHYDLSVRDCLYVLRQDPNNELAHVRLGSAYYALGMQQYAVKVWQKALQLNPYNADLKEFMQEKNVPIK